jgi:type I restriction enzyme S subunit
MSSAHLPTSWKMVTLEAVAADVPNAIVDGPFGSNLKVNDYVDSGVPVLQGKNITGDTFVWRDVRFISKLKAHELRRSSVRPGDILLVKIGSIGYSAIVTGLNGFENAIIPANLAKVTPDPNRVDTAYLHHWLKTPETKAYLIGAASKTAQPALSLSKIKALPVPLPPLKDQRRIAATLDAADVLRAKRCATIKRCDALAQVIFAEMFNKVLTCRDRVPLATLVLEFRYGTSNKSASYGYTALRIPNVIGGGLIYQS